MPYDAHPVRSYDEALYWLLKKLPEADIQAILSEDQPLPLIADFMCDVHWINRDKLRKDVGRKVRELS